MGLTVQLLTAGAAPSRQNASLPSSGRSNANASRGPRLRDDRVMRARLRNVPNALSAWGDMERSSLLDPVTSENELVSRLGDSSFADRLRAKFLLRSLGVAPEKD